MQHLLSAADLDRTEIEALFEAAWGFASGTRTSAVERGAALVCLAFFENSLRTRVGFDAAAARLGLPTTTVFEPKHNERMSAPESLSDTMRALGAYCDLICLRHQSADAPSVAADAAGVPVINCGNGLDEHPTQALGDLFAIAEARGGEIDGTRIALVGDLRHMRAPRSLLVMLGRFEDVAVRCISPPELAMPRRWIEQFGGAVEETAEMEVEDVDIVYMAGLAPRTPVGDFAPEVRARYVLDFATAARLGEDVHILCPMPRIDEIAPEVDSLPNAVYFEQSARALFVRMAVLERALSA